MEYDISNSFFFFFFFLGEVGYIFSSPCMLISVCFPLRIVATVEPNWLENVIDRVEYVLRSGQLEQHM